MVHPSLYRAKAVGVSKDGVIQAFIPQVFGESPVFITEVLGGMPSEPGMGWVFFQAGNCEFPVWAGNTGEDGGGAAAPTRRIVKADTSTAYAPIVSDENKMITLSNAAPITVTLPSDAVAFPSDGGEVDFLWLGVGQVTFVAGAGAVANGTPGMRLRSQFSAATAKKIAANTWVVIGDLRL